MERPYQTFQDTRQVCTFVLPLEQTDTATDWSGCNIPPGSPHAPQHLVTFLLQCQIFHIFSYKVTNFPKINQYGRYEDRNDNLDRNSSSLVTEVSGDWPDDLNTSDC